MTTLVYNYLDVNSAEGLAVGYDVFSGVNGSGSALSLEPGTYKIVAIKTHEELRALGGKYASNLASGVTRIFFNTTSGFPNTDQNSVLTFRGYGPNAAFKSYKTKFKLNEISAVLPVVNNADTGQPTEFNVVTTASQDLTSADGTTWEVGSTAGIKVGNTIYAKGLGFSSSGERITVASIVADATLTTVAALASGYTILNGTTMYFTGSAATVTISGNIDFINLGDTNFTLTLDLDRILTLTDNY